MELVTKEYLEDNIKTYDTYRGLDKIGVANGIATLDANGLVTWSQIPQLGDPNGIATLDSNGTVPASQLDLTSVVTVTPSITSSDTGAYSVGSVTVNNTTVDLYGRDTPVTVTPGSIQSTDPDAYLAGTIVANGTTTELYGKDTTYQKAQNDSLGLVMPGANNIASGTLDPDNDWYPVAVDSNGHMYVNVQARQKGPLKLNNKISINRITPGTGDNSDFATVTFVFDSSIASVKLTYAAHNIGIPQDAKCKIGHKGSSNIVITITSADKAIYIASKNTTSYLYATCVTTDNRVYDTIIKVNLLGKNAPCSVDIL